MKGAVPPSTMAPRLLLLASLLLASVANAAQFPLVCCDPTSGKANVAFTHDKTAFAWIAGDGTLRAAVTANRGPIPADQQIVLGQKARSEAAIASDGERALFVWTEGTGVKAELIPPINNSLQPIFLGFNPNDTPPAVVWNGTHYVVLWSHLSNAVLARAIDAQGNLEEKTHVLSPGGADVPFRLSIASAGNDSLAVWDRYVFDLEGNGITRRSELAVVAADGTPREAPRTLTTTGFGPSVASNGREYFVVWHDATFEHLRGSVVSASGAIQGEKAIADGRSARLAWNGSQYVLLWQTLVFFRPQVTYALMSENGDLLHAPVYVAGDLYDYEVASQPETGETALVTGTSIRQTLSEIQVLYLDPLRARPVRRF